MAHETRKLADFVSSTRYKDLPAAVVHEAKRHILDSLGAAVLGTNSEPANAVLKTIAILGGSQECTVIGHGGLSNPFNAALANGTAAYSTLMDDFYSGRGMVHPGNHVVTTALAMGEHVGIDGQSLIRSVVVGYEVSCRATDAAGISQDRMGFYAGSTNSQFGSAAAAASVLGLDQERTCHALGLAGAQVCGIKEVGVQTNMSQGFHAGKAAANGILAALLASEGLVAGDTVFESPSGYLKMFSTDPDPNQLVSDLGAGYRIGQVGFKIYPAAAPISSTIDAAIRLHDKHHISSADIDEISVKSHRLELTSHNWPDPDKRLAALRSNQYCVAIGLLQGHAKPADFRDAVLQDPVVRGLMKRVRIELDPELDAAGPRLFGSRVAVHTRDGRVFEETVPCAKGMVDDPLTDDELIAKFFEMTDGVIPRQRSEAIQAGVWGLETLGEVGDLTKLLRFD
jgi:2-methylcitrate dehydratase PrpD